MELKNKIYNIFIDKLGKPDSNIALLEYIEFTINYDNAIIDSEYFERHHILPSSQFKLYSKTDWNIVKLKYEDHITAHEMLYMAYITRSNLYPLNFMKSQLSKDSKMVSKATKRAWISLKNNKTNYNKWLKSRSKYMKSISSEERSRRTKLMWESLSEKEYLKRCEINKNIWTDELKERKSKQMKEFFKKNPNEASRRTKKRWDNISKSDKAKFDEKMKDVNSSTEKRKAAGATLKDKWKNDKHFIDKMKHRVPHQKKYKLISPCGEIIERLGMSNIIKEFNFNYYLINKFANTGKPVASKNVKNKETISNTIGWTFEFIEYSK